MDTETGRRKRSFIKYKYYKSNTVKPSLEKSFKSPVADNSYLHFDMCVTECVCVPLGLAAFSKTRINSGTSK